MDLNALSAEIEKTCSLDDLDVAAAVDLDAMFQDGSFELLEELEGSAITLSKRPGTVVQGDVDVETLEVKHSSLVVLGNVSATTVEISGCSVLVVGNLEVRETIVGSSAPHVLTVVGRVDIGRAEMREQFIMQFLGSGRISELYDDERGSEELLNMLREAGSNLIADRIVDDSDEEEDVDEQ